MRDVVLPLTTIRAYLFELLRLVDSQEIRLITSYEGKLYATFAFRWGVPTTVMIGGNINV